MKILKQDLKTRKWVPLVSESPPLPLRISLSDKRVIEITEGRDRQGLSYLALRTLTGNLAIYPEMANKVSFRIVDH